MLKSDVSILADIIEVLVWSSTYRFNISVSSKVIERSSRVDRDIRLEHGEPPAEARSRDGNDSNKWHDIISCNDKESFLSAVREQAPRDWLLSNQRILEYANLYYPEEKPEYEAPHTTVERERYPEISEWENQAAIGDSRPER